MSIFAHIEVAPATNPDWATNLVIVGLGIVAAAIGAIAFRLRDVQYA